MISKEKVIKIFKIILIISICLIAIAITINEIKFLNSRFSHDIKYFSHSDCLECIEQTRNEFKDGIIMTILFFGLYVIGGMMLIRGKSKKKIFWLSPFLLTIIYFLLFSFMFSFDKSRPCYPAYSVGLNSLGHTVVAFCSSNYSLINLLETINFYIGVLAFLLIILIFFSFYKIIKEESLMISIVYGFYYTFFLLIISFFVATSRMIDFEAAGAGGLVFILFISLILFGGVNLLIIIITTILRKLVKKTKVTKIEEKRIPSEKKKTPSYILGLAAVALPFLLWSISFFISLFIPLLNKILVIHESSKNGTITLNITNILIIVILSEVLVFIIAIFGLIRGVKELKQLKKWRAIFGIVLCSIALVQAIYGTFTLMPFNPLF